MLSGPLMVAVDPLHITPSAENCEHMVFALHAPPSERLTMRSFMPGGPRVPFEQIVQSISPGDGVKLRFSVLLCHVTPLS